MNEKEKKEKLYELQWKIAERAERVKYLLESISFYRNEALIMHKDDTLCIGVLASIAMDETEKIEKYTEKLSKIWQCMNAD